METIRNKIWNWVEATSPLTEEIWDRIWTKSRMEDEKWTIFIQIINENVRHQIEDPI